MIIAGSPENVSSLLRTPFDVVSRSLLAARDIVVEDIEMSLSSSSCPIAFANF
jgi:hypothetical protein